MTRKKVIEHLRLQTQNGKHIIGVVAGSGMTAKCVHDGGADFLLALNSGRYRQMGRSSLAGFFPFENSNDMVMDFATKEILPLIEGIPVIFGYNATDPTKDMKQYIEKIRHRGFSGINNYPTVGMIDGDFGKALEEEGICYEQEVEAIHLAHQYNLFTIAFVFDEHQAEQMIKAGADVICVHLGFTGGGLLGVKKVFSLESARTKVNRIFEFCNTLRPDLIKMIYGGPVKTPIDAQYMYGNNDNIMGYIGGSAFDRIPVEKSMINTTKTFKYSGILDSDDLMSKMLDGISKHYDYVEFVKEYVSHHYMDEIVFSNLAKLANVSRSYLSTLFKKEVGCSFQNYLIKFRMDKAIEVLTHENIPLSELPALVGYSDYVQFSKMFKKYTGTSPRKYKKNYIENKTKLT